MSRKIKISFLAVLFCLGSLIGCSRAPETDQALKPPEEPEPTTLTLLTTVNSANAGLMNVLKLAEDTLGIKIQLEYRASGETGENIVMTRLVSGEMADLCCFSGGALFKKLHPEDYFMDLTDQDFVSDYEDCFRQSVTVNGIVYGVPGGYDNGVGAILYNRDIYEKYHLDIPETWDMFLQNCDILEAAGETAVLGGFAQDWTSQVCLLADYYNVQKEIPNFADLFELGKIKYSAVPAALRSWQKTEDLVAYYNEDAAVINSHEAGKRLVEGKGAHYLCLTDVVLSSLYDEYGTSLPQLGIFAIPGDQPGKQGITIWPANGIYANKYSEHPKEIMDFLNFYMSDEAIQAYFQKKSPVGPLAVKGLDFPIEMSEIVLNEQQYIDEGRYCMALEFQTTLKGGNCIEITRNVLNGNLSYLEAAREYDEDCLKTAISLGLDWGL